MQLEGFMRNANTAAPLTTDRNPQATNPQAPTTDHQQADHHQQDGHPTANETPHTPDDRPTTNDGQPPAPQPAADNDRHTDKKKKYEPKKPSKSLTRVPQASLSLFGRGKSWRNTWGGDNSESKSSFCRFSPVL